MGLLDPPGLTKRAADQRYGSGDIFNWKSSNTRRLQRSLGNAIAGTGFADHVIPGDSTSAGYMGSQNYLGAWPRVMGNLLNARGVPLAGTGWVPTGNYAPTIPGEDPRWSTTGTWTDGTTGYQSTTQNGATLTFTSDLPGTAVSVAYSNTTSAFTVSIDGGTPVAVSISGVAQTVGFYTVTGLANTTHTVTITATTSSTTIPFAVQVYRSSGLRIHNVAQISESALRWAPAAYADRSWVANHLGINADVVHIALGVNDLNGSQTVAQLITDLTTIRNAWPNADAILYGQYQPGPARNGNALWAQYIAALYQLAVTLDCPLVDLYQRSGGYTVANANTMMGDDVHPNAAAQSDWGHLAANLVLKAL